MAPTSVLEDLSQLSFPDDDELRRDFESRPLLSSRKKKKKKKKRRSSEMPPSPLEQLQIQTTEASNALVRSPKIPSKRKLKPLSKNDPTKKATNDERPRTSTTNSHKTKKPPVAASSLDSPIPRKRKKKYPKHQESSSLEIPYALDFGNQRTTSNNERRNEPLRAGDIIHYNNPLFVAGTKQALTVTQILAIDPSVLNNRDDDEDDDVFPLDLANGQMIPIDTFVIRIKEYRDGELFPHHGICRQIKDFRWIKGKLSGPTGLQRQMEAYRSVIAQAQQQLEDEMDQHSERNKNEGGRSLETDESNSTDEESVSSSVSSGPIPKITIPERRSNPIVDGIFDKSSPERLVVADSQNQTLQLSKAKSLLSQIQSIGKENGTAKGIFDASSDDEELLKPRETMAPRKPTKSVLEDSSGEEETTSSLRVCSKAQLERRRNSSRSSNQFRGSKDLSREKKPSSKASSRKHLPAHSQRNDGNQNDFVKPALKLQKDVFATKKVAKRPIVDDTSDSDVEDKLPPSMLRRKSDSSRSTVSKALLQKRDPPNVTCVPKQQRIKSFLNVSPVEGEAALRREELSAEVKKKQKEEIDRLVGIAAEKSETKKSIKVKHSKTSSFFPRSVEDASSCNEFANQSSSDEDDESFFRKKKMAKIMNKTDEGDLSSITTTFTNSQSSMENKRSKHQNRLISGLKRPFRPSHKMKLHLQPVPQEDESF